MDADLDELIARRATAREIRNAALAKGFRTLAEDGVRRVLDGSTSLDELGACGRPDRAHELGKGQWPSIPTRR